MFGHGMKRKDTTLKKDIFKWILPRRRKNEENKN